MLIALIVQAIIGTRADIKEIKMNNILNKSCTNQEYADFALYCNENGFHVEATESDFYALESYQTIRNNEIFDLRNDTEFQNQQVKIEADLRKIAIANQIDELDKKRIRAMCEPAIKDAQTGETWLSYYNSLIVVLRQELAQIG
jgi:GTP cyclohydrolase II